LANPPFLERMQQNGITWSWRQPPINIFLTDARNEPEGVSVTSLLMISTYIIYLRRDFFYQFVLGYVLYTIHRIDRQCVILSGKYSGFQPLGCILMVSYKEILSKTWMKCARGNCLSVIFYYSYCSDTTAGVVVWVYSYAMVMVWAMEGHNYARFVNKLIVDVESKSQLGLSG
jgi:hypothetical protein